MERRFYFRLALALGMTVSALLESISSRELTEWMEFYKLEPFGYEVEMFGQAQVAATIVNVNRKKGTKAYDVHDFYPRMQGGSDIAGAIEIVKSAMKGE